MPGDPVVLSARIQVGGSNREAARLQVDFELAAGVTAVMGPSGAGKTTLVQALAGLLPPVAGRITLHDTVLFDQAQGIDIPPHRRRIAVVFQSLALFPHMPVWKNVAYGAPPSNRREVAQVWLERVHAGRLAERRPGTLSGGEAQRVALARALASAPRLVLLDEPFSALDQGLRTELGDVLRALLSDAGIPCLLITHDPRDAQRLASRILTIEGGRITGDEPTGHSRDL